MPQKQCRKIVTCSFWTNILPFGYILWEVMKPNSPFHKRFILLVHTYGIRRCLAFKGFILHLLPPNCLVKCNNWCYLSMFVLLFMILVYIIDSMILYWILTITISYLMILFLINRNNAMNKSIILKSVFWWSNFSFLSFLFCLNVW